MRIRIAVDNGRISLPTYTVIEHDPRVGIAIVDVPDADLPDNAAVRHLLKHNGPLAAPSRLPTPTLVLTQWYRHLDRRYAERAGQYRPVVI